MMTAAFSGVLAAAAFWFGYGVGYHRHRAKIQRDMAVAIAAHADALDGLTETITAETKASRDWTH